MVLEMRGAKYEAKETLSLWGIERVSTLVDHFLIQPTKK